MDFSGIFDFKSNIQQNFIEWLKGKYLTVDALNAAYGASYASFESIDVAASDSVQGYSEYITLPFSPSEIYELVSRSTEAGLTEYTMPTFIGMNDIVLNRIHGQSKFMRDLNLAGESDEIKRAYIHPVSAFYPG